MQKIDKSYQSKHLLKYCKKLNLKVIIDYDTPTKTYNIKILNKEKTKTIFFTRNHSKLNKAFKKTYKFLYKYKKTIKYKTKNLFADCKSLSLAVSIDYHSTTSYSIEIYKRYQSKFKTYFYTDGEAELQDALNKAQEFINTTFNDKSQIITKLKDFDECQWFNFKKSELIKELKSLYGANDESIDELFKRLTL